MSGGYGHSPTTGREWQKQVYKYTGGTWETAGQLTVARQFHTMDVLHGQMMVVGGYNGDYLDSVELLEDESWKNVSWSLSNARYAHAMAVVPSEAFPCIP